MTDQGPHDTRYETRIARAVAQVDAHPDAPHTLAVARVWRSYLHPDRLIAACTRPRAWATAAGIDITGSRLAGASRDDPDLTPPSRCRYDEPRLPPRHGRPRHPCHPRLPTDPRRCGHARLGPHPLRPRHPLPSPQDLTLPDFPATFARLRSLMHDAAPGFTVTEESPTTFTLKTTWIEARSGQPAWFGWVAIKKSCVAYHVMPLYCLPALESAVSPALAGRRQGKTCFNFKSPDDPLIADLRPLTAKAARLEPALRAAIGA